MGDAASKILECSSKGDKRFSAFYAKVSVFGKWDSIENHYQLAKRFGDVVPVTWRDGKGKTATHIDIRGHKLDLKYLTPWYKYLWLLYLDKHPELVSFASTFDDFNDIFKGKSTNCQADVIRQYIKVGRESILKECEEFLSILNQPDLPAQQHPETTTPRVVHCKVDPYDIYIGRPSKWGNPFTHKTGTTAPYIRPTREEALAAYREWILEQPHLLKDLHELRGKTLACWCKPQACHGDVLLELANGPLGEERKNA